LGRIDRYLLKEIGTPLLISVVVVVMMVFLFQARRFATAALGFGLTFGDAVVIFSSALPPFLVLAIPIAYLTSVLIGLGRLSQDLELVALRAAGASPFRLARVPILLGVLVSLIAVPIAVRGEPYGMRKLYERLLDVGLRNLSSAIRPGVFNEDFRGSALFAQRSTRDGRVEEVLLYDERDPARPFLVAAQRGKLSPTPQGLSFALQDGEVHLGAGQAGETYERLHFEGVELALDADAELVRRTRFVSTITQMTNGEIWEIIERDGDSPFARRIEKAYWRRYAFPTMAAVFGVIGAAIGLTAAPRARARNAVLGLLVVMGYYFMTRVADIVVIGSANLSFWGAWLPNLLVLAVGLFTLLRAGRPS